MFHKDLARRSFLKTGLLAAPLSSALVNPGMAKEKGRAAGPKGHPGPSKPKLTLNVREFGATGDGATKDTAAIQQTIDRCWVLGGGEALVPAGNYLTGAIALRSNTVLRLDQDAIIRGTPDFADYPVTQVRWEGNWIQGRLGLIYALDAAHIGVVGPGKIIGNSALSGRPNAQNPLRHPSLIEPIGCHDVRFEDFSTEYHVMWCLHATYCENVVFKNLTIHSTGGNADGIDIDSCRHVLIDGCDISTGDDCIAIKSGRGAFIEDIVASDLDVAGTRGGFLRFNILNSGIQDQAPVPGDEGIPTIKNFRFSNVRVADCPILVDGTGIHPHKPLEGFSLVNVTGTCAKGISLANIRKAEIRNIKVTGYSGPLLSISNVTGKGLEGATTIEPLKLPDPVPPPAKPYQLH